MIFEKVIKGHHPFYKGHHPFYKGHHKGHPYHFSNNNNK